MGRIEWLALSKSHLINAVTEKVQSWYDKCPVTRLTEFSSPKRWDSGNPRMIIGVKEASAQWTFRVSQVEF